MSMHPSGTILRIESSIPGPRFRRPTITSPAFVSPSFAVILKKFDRQPSREATTEMKPCCLRQYFMNFTASWHPSIAFECLIRRASASVESGAGCNTDNAYVLYD